MITDFGIATPMANEETDFAAFTAAVARALDDIGGGIMYLVVDKASRDRTLALCRELSARDTRFVTVWAPENRNVVDAYLRGFREICAAGHAYVVEMDAGLSHDPAEIPRFLDALEQGCECAFGSRYVAGGSNADSPASRQCLSRGGTILANALLGTRLRDMTSGFQAFQRGVVEDLLAHGLRSQAHFYQTEIRYLLRNRNAIEIPIAYKAPSPRVSRKAIWNSLGCLAHYARRRALGRAESV